MNTEEKYQALKKKYSILLSVPWLYVSLATPTDPSRLRQGERWASGIAGREEDAAGSSQRDLSEVGLQPAERQWRIYDEELMIPNT
jgi:hypothetical protein